VSSTFPPRVTARFVEPAGARSCFHELRWGQIWRGDATVCVRPRSDLLDIPYEASDARGALLRGMILGGLVGVLLALAVAALAVSALRLDLGLLGPLLAIGAVLGAMLGALLWPPPPHPALSALDSGQPLALAVRSDDPEVRAWAERIVSRWGEVPRNSRRPPRS
jgi:hypothetical protein